MFRKYYIVYRKRRSLCPRRKNGLLAARYVPVCLYWLGSVPGFLLFTHMNQLAVSSEPYAESVAVYMGGESESGQTFSGKVEPEKQQKVYIDSEKGSIKKHTSKKAIRSKRAISFLSMRARIILTKLSKPICKLK